LLTYATNGNICESSWRTLILEKLALAESRARDFYTVPEAARTIGVSPSTVWRWIAADKLPAYRVGPKSIRVKPADLAAVIRPARASPKPPPTEQQTRPALEAPTQAELARRQALVADILASREERRIAPLTTAALVRQVREDEQARHAPR
jgi:excisionase family DNA binding protein